MSRIISRRKLKEIAFPMPEPGGFLKLLIEFRPGSVSILETRLWEVRKGHLLLQQTEPPLTSALRGNTVKLSYMATVLDGEPMRVGFKAPLLAIVDLPGGRGQILVFPVPFSSNIKPVSLRAFSRFSPGNLVKLNASLQLEGLSLPMNAVGDLSLGGARLLHKGGLPLPDGQRLRLSLGTAEETMLLPATLMRQENELEDNQASLAVRFVDLSEAEQKFLKEALNQICKQRRSRMMSELAEKAQADNREQQADK